MSLWSEKGYLGSRSKPLLPAREFVNQRRYLPGIVSVIRCGGVCPARGTIALYFLNPVLICTVLLSEQSVIVTGQFLKVLVALFEFIFESGNIRVEDNHVNRW